ncbi:DNA methyltransferase [Segetibacter koreensis]|uniref:DNA methyltransferase n=1 Tax=Segetibacter koreensis TaxID=398037 RepID=UPI0003823DD5|nr:DNA methyltransferase [Segetibacter koreensis]
MLDKLTLQSPDLVSENIQKIATLFPNCVTETANGKAIDFDQLRQELNPDIVESTKERYRLEWPGKREAIVTANLPTTKTLRPIKEESVDFDNTQNLYIEGDNLEVLKLLQESYLGKIKMIYIDPPYNTGNDFIYKDNFVQDKAQFEFDSGLKDEYNQRLVPNSESNGRYHSDWLTMIYPRLKLARNLLKDDGVLFISIDDNEVHNLKKVCDEIYGEINFVADICVVNNLKGRNDKRYIATANERLLMYVKTDFYEEVGLRLPDTRINEFNNEDNIGKYRELGLRKRGGADTRQARPNMFFPLFVNPKTGEVSVEKSDSFSKEVLPRKSDNSDGCWRWGKETARLKIKTLIGRAVSGGSKWDVFEKDYLETDGELRKIKPKSVFSGTSYSTDRATKEYRSLLSEAEFSSPKSVSMLSDLIEYAVPNINSEIILDFFSGSATTAHATLKLNAEDNGDRRFIMVQLPESVDMSSNTYKAGFKNICEIGKERIRRAGISISNELKEEVQRLGQEKEKLIAEIDEERSEILPSIEKIDELNTRIEIISTSIDFKNNTLSHLDTGFRVFREDSSNMQDVYYKPQDYNQQNLDLFANNIKPDRTPQDLLAQIMLIWGLPLHYCIETLSIQDKKVFKIAENSLFACFNDGIDEAFAKEIATYHPLRIVFNDASFKDDTAKENVKQLLKQLSPLTEMKVI